MKINYNHENYGNHKVCWPCQPQFNECMRKCSNSDINFRTQLCAVLKIWQLFIIQQATFYQSHYLEWKMHNNIEKKKKIKIQAGKTKINKCFLLPIARTSLKKKLNLPHLNFTVPKSFLSGRPISVSTYQHSILCKNIKVLDSK